MSVRSVPDAPKNGFHAQNKFSGTERLRNVVVGAQFETDDAIDLLAARSQHQNGNAAGGDLLTERAADLHAVHVREASRRE